MLAPPNDTPGSAVDSPHTPDHGGNDHLAGKRPAGTDEAAPRKKQKHESEGGDDDSDREESSGHPKEGKPKQSRGSRCV